MSNTSTVNLPPNLRAFHLAFPINDLETTRKFYAGVLECEEGRSSETWIDFDFWGNQISLHLGTHVRSQTKSQVAGNSVPIPHFGAILSWDEFFALEKRMSEAGVEFLHPAQVRFEGEPGEQATMFVADPSGNALEFKSFRHPDEVFAH